MKNAVLAVLIMAGLLLSAGCTTGVSESQYYALKSELQSVKAEIASQKVLNKVDPRVTAYAEINDMLMDSLRVASGQPSKFGYGKGDADKWAKDLQQKMMAQNDLILTEMLGAYLVNTPGKTQFQKGTEIMSYVSQKLVTLTGK
jgi:uncharacterized lipoprotein YmbA